MPFARPRFPKSPRIPVMLFAFALLAAFAAVSSGPLVAQAGGGVCHQAPSNQDETGNAVLMRAYCFAPTVLRVETGAKVTFRNNDEAVHQVNGLAWGSTGGLSQYATTEQTFTAPGLYPYACILHPGMVGVVVVGDGKFV
ncbi:MAG: cupredoxin domain-containing protein, partial [Tepidiformaceae bacterium]